MKITYEELIERASHQKKAPVEAFVPRQRLPSWLRFFLRLLFLPFIVLDLAAQSLAKAIIRPPYKKTGSCLQRGNCCHYILMEKSKGFLGRLHFFWHTEINGFYKRDIELREAGKEMHVMGCRYLQANGRCAIYRFRPMICRKWPVIEAFAKPRILKGCGYQVLCRKNAKQSR